MLLVVVYHGPLRYPFPSTNFLLSFLVPLLVITNVWASRFIIVVFRRKVVGAKVVEATGVGSLLRVQLI